MVSLKQIAKQAKDSPALCNDVIADETALLEQTL